MMGSLLSRLKYEHYTLGALFRGTGMKGGGRKRTRGSHSRRKIYPLALLAVLAIALGYFAFSGSTPNRLTTAPKDVNSGVTGLDVGNLAPNFNLKATDGSAINLTSLAGKPVVIWFTATWCVPCQLGAKELLKYDVETGGNAFSVVVVFVDPSTDTNDQIRQWKNNFGGSHWFTALDTTGMANNYQVKYLDTKYVLDRNGIIAWKDIYQLQYDTAKSVLQPLIG